MNVLIMAVVWILDYFGARLLLKTVEFGSPLAIVYALLPIPAFIGLLIAIFMQIKKMDELQRKIHFEALAVAFPLAITTIMVLGLLELAVQLSDADWSYRHVWPILVLYYIVGLAISRRKYA